MTELYPSLSLDALDTAPNARDWLMKFAGLTAYADGPVGGIVSRYSIIHLEPAGL